MPHRSAFAFAAAGPSPSPSMGLADSTSNLAILASSMKMVPFIGSILEGVVETMQKLCERAQHMRESKQKLQDVIKHAVDILVALGTSWETMDPFRRDRMRSTVEVFATCLQGVLDAAEQISKPKLLGRLIAPLRPNRLAAAIEALSACLVDAVVLFQMESKDRSRKRDKVFAIFLPGSRRSDIQLRSRMNMAMLRHHSSSRSNPGSYITH